MPRPNRITLAAFLLTALFAPVAQAQDGYRTVSGPRPASDPDTIEVIEFFWYGCPHCYNFEPLVREWKRDLRTT
jgi:thiol:disulfide interchange protein DsbA